MKIIPLIVFLFIVMESSAQDSVDVIMESQIETELHPGKQRVGPESITPALISELKEDGEYAYMDDLDSLLRSRSRSQEVTSIPNTRNIFDSAWFFYPALLIILVFLGYLLYRIIKTKGHFFKKKRTRIVVDELVDETVVFSPGDLSEALKNEDYRLAIRIWFLNTLSALNDGGVIENSPGKSNRDYISELQPPLKIEFRFLVLKYEYFWYGNHQPGSEQYWEVEKDFKDFHLKYLRK